MVANNAGDGVTWVHSYVSVDKSRTFCVYDGLRRRPFAASRSGTICRSITLPKCACGIRISINDLMRAGMRLAGFDLANKPGARPLLLVLAHGFPHLLSPIFM